MASIDGFGAGYVLHVNLPEDLALAHADEAPLEELENGEEIGDDHLRGRILPDELAESDAPAAADQAVHRG